MRTLNLTPAGKQPVKIATTMAIGMMAEENNHFAALGKMVKSITKRASKVNIYDAACYVGGTCTFLSMFLAHGNDFVWPRVALIISAAVYLLSFIPRLKS